MSEYPRDEFDDVPEDGTRQGAHRGHNPQARTGSRKGFLAIVGAGILALAVGAVAFVNAPRTAQDAVENTPAPSGNITTSTTEPSPSETSEGPLEEPVDPASPEVPAAPGDGAVPGQDPAAPADPGVPQDPAAPAAPEAPAVPEAPAPPAAPAQPAPEAPANPAPEAPVEAPVVPEAPAGEPGGTDTGAVEGAPGEAGAQEQAGAADVTTEGEAAVTEPSAAAAAAPGPGQ